MKNMNWEAPLLIIEEIENTESIINFPGWNLSA
jgi:hypothetical protein